MKTIQRILLFYLILSCLLCVLYALPAATNENDDQGASDYDYYEDDDTKKPYINNIDTLDQKQEPPYFEQTELKINAVPGEHVILNCDVRNFQIRNVVVWYRDETIITNGQFPIGNPRIEGLKNNSIRIKNVEAGDEGNYYCVVLPESIRLHIKLDIAKKLAIYNNGVEVTNRSIIVSEGETHIFDCRAAAPHPVEVKWSFNGQRAESVASRIEGSKMFINNMDDINQGTYQCLGDDGSRMPSHGWINLIVHHSPKVSTHRHYVNTELGGIAELYCDFKSNLYSSVRWYKHGVLVNPSSKYTIKTFEHKHRNRTELTVKNTNVDDLGDYNCKIENNIGANEVKIHVVLEPEVPQFEAIDIKENVVIMQWIVKSRQPLSEAILDYKMSGSFTWSTQSVIHTERHSNKASDLWKIYHEMELPPGKWHARVKTRNTSGWSKFSAQYDFTVKDYDDKDQSEEVQSPPADIAFAGIGVPKSSGNNTATAVLSSFTLTAVTCLTLFCIRA